MSIAHSNELIHETSPYLLQHAHNPVNWFPWNENSLQKAKAEDKPILISIGYAACHWCHVMEKESFENEAVAALMNNHFVNIKIDREERPDLDHIYMDALQAIAGNGGWPLNVFLTSEALPFYGGTYFPPQRAYNRPSWTEVLQLIIDLWKNKREAVGEQAKKLVDHLKSSSDFFINQTIVFNEEHVSLFNKELCAEISKAMLANADIVAGGFGTAPKFPQTFSIQYLLSYSHFFNDAASKTHAILSLEKIASGGIYDQLAGGLARYSTDANWLAPHFEKMLYDNALWVSVLCDAYQLTQHRLFKSAIEKTVQFCINELKDSQGGFYAAIDADSDGEEGKYYVWNSADIIEILGPETGAIFCKWYNVTETGNWEGKNILHHSNNIEEFAQYHQLSATELESILMIAEKKLLAQRNKRNRPLTDDKILLGWNALFITALCKASASLKSESYKKEAVSLYHFLKEKFSLNGQIFFHSYKLEIAKNPAFLDDFANLIQACILLQEITGDDQYLIDAKEMTELLIKHFSKEGSCFFYYTGEQQKDVIIRKVDINDNAVPSGNSQMAENLFYLSIIFDQKDWYKRGAQMLQSVLPLVKKHPNSFANWAQTLLKIAVGRIEIVLTGDEYSQILEEIVSIYLPHKIIQSSNKLKDYPLLKNKSFSKNTSIYTCKDFSCFPPVETISAFRKTLKW